MYLLPARLKELRIQKQWTQEQVARRIGVTRAALSMYENGTRQPSYEILIEFSILYNVSCDYLLGCERKKLIDVSGLNEYDIAAVEHIISALRNH